MKHYRRIPVSVLSGLLWILAGCGGGNSTPSSPPPPPTPAVAVSVSPSSATVAVGATVQFAASVSNSTNQTVTWQVNQNSGGSTSTGTISNSGLYTAPSAIPQPSTVTVTAVSQADSTKSASASVSVTIIVAASIAGATAGTLQTFMSTNLQPRNTFDTGFFTRAADAKMLLDALGSHHIRISPTSSAAPQTSPTTWDFSLLDPSVQPTLSLGDHSPQLELALPGFMGNGSGGLRSANYQPFADYAANLVRYYNAGGFDANGTHFQSQSSNHVTWWSIYNEPNFFFAPDQYAALYNTVVPAMKSVDPSIKFAAVQLGDLGGSGRNDWPQQFMPTFVADVTAPVDAVGTHLYSTCDQRDSDQALFDSISAFVDHVQFISGSLKANPALANVPVWVTENNINASFDGAGGTPGFSVCNGVTLPFKEDLRANSAFFAAWRPLVFSRLAQAGAQALFHWDFNAGLQFGEYDDNDPPNTEKVVLSYWVDYELGHYFPNPPGAEILTVINPDAADVEILAVKNPEASVVAMIVNHAVHSATDNNGQGDPRSVTLDISGLGPFKTATLLRIDAHTDPTTGPTATSMAITNPMPIAFDGYGTAFLLLKL